MVGIDSRFRDSSITTNIDRDGLYAVLTIAVAIFETITTLLLSLCGPGLTYDYIILLFSSQLKSCSQDVFFPRK